MEEEVDKRKKNKEKEKKECDKVGFGVHEEGIEAKGYVFLLRELARKRQRDKSLIQDECYQG